MSYHLVHITTSGEYMTPLVASQLFDQAEVQAATQGDDKPLSVSVWVMCNMREMFSKQAREKIALLRQRCPHVEIRLIGGSDRLGGFPANQSVFMWRRLLGTNERVVYHCRTEFAGLWGLKIKKHFPKDKVVVDVRGYWPAELLYKRGIEDPENARGKDALDLEEARKRLKDVVKQVDAVTTVSEELRALLINSFNAKESTTVVPCCVKDVSDDTHRSSIRAQWGIGEDEIVITYSGTAAAYQHLEDLTLPFLYDLSRLNNKVRVVILTPDKKVVNEMLTRYEFTHPVILENVPQKEVAKYLTAADAGILIRKPTLVNRVANPVKIAEYFAGGLSLIVEDGVGGVPYTNDASQVVKRICIATGNSIEEEAAKVNSWLLAGSYRDREAARSLAIKNYYWSSAVKVHRKTYNDLLTASEGSRDAQIS